MIYYLLWTGIAVILAVFLFFMVVLYVRDAPAREIQQQKGVTFESPDPQSIVLGRRDGDFVCLDLANPKEPEIVIWPAGLTEVRYGHVHVHVQRLPEMWSDWKWEEVA